MTVPPARSRGRRRAETPSTWTGMLATLPAGTLRPRAARPEGGQPPRTTHSEGDRRSRRRGGSGDERRGIRPGLLAASGAGAVALAVLTSAAILPGLASSEQTDAAPPAQSLRVIGAELSAAPRDSYTATPGEETYVAGGTNRDWASLVLLYGDWPVTEENVTVIMRWMRQENYEKSWWNRNNPLNNGWGSGGGGGLGSYPNLRVAAQNAAEAIHTHPGYAGIRDGFAASAPTEVIEAAIWASPWASSHYANGAHWHYTPTQVIKAPADAW